jgi:hypothetical protein
MSGMTGTGMIVEIVEVIAVAAGEDRISGEKFAGFVPKIWLRIIKILIYCVGLLPREERYSHEGLPEPAQSTSAIFRYR